MTDITEDDIQVGGTADVKWRKNNQSAIYPAKIQRSRRTKSGHIEYSVHYKNWNKRYDEWVTLDRIMRVFDESGKLLKQRPDSSEDDEGSEGSEGEPPLKKPAVSLRDKIKGSKPKPKPEPDSGPSEEEKDESDSDQVPVITNYGAGGLLDDLGRDSEPEEENSDEEDEDEEDEAGSNETNNPVACAAQCGKDAQVDSIYCSVECILKHAMKVPNKDSSKEPSKSSPTDVPALETAPPDAPPDDDSRSDDDEDFVPENDSPKPKKVPKKIKKESKRSRKAKEAKTPPPKSPKASHKKLTDKDIDDIMARVSGMKDEEPIMVMKYGALLTGVAAPRKNNLREFLEENRIGVKVMISDERKTESFNRIPVRKNDRDLVISRDNRMRKAELTARQARPIQTVAPFRRESPKENPSTSTSGLNPYARREETRKKTEKKEVKEKKLKKEPKKEKNDNDEDEITGTDLLKLVKRKQKSEKKERMEKERESNITPTREKPFKRSSIGERDEHSLPKKIRRASDHSTPLRGNRTPEQPDRTPEGQRHKVRKMLRDVLTHRSQNSHDLKMDLQSITKLVAKIEKNLFQKYQCPNKQYLTKVRQINYNLKDCRNDDFWRKVITGQISSSQLHEMNNQDMAPNDLMEARKQQEKDYLDGIKRQEEERQKEALKPTSKITHKGEIEIENFEEPLEKTQDFGAEISLNTTKGDDEKKVEKKKKKKSDKKKRSESKISKAEEDTINRMIAQKPKLKVPTVEEPMPIPSDVGPDVDESLGLESPKTPDYCPEDGNDMETQSPGSPEKSPEALTPPQPMTPPPPLDDEPLEKVQKTSPAISKIWSGKLSFPEASTFNANGYIISGTMDSATIKHSLTDRLHVAGRLDVSAAEKYITEVRQSSDVNRISIMSLYGKSSSEETGYSDSLFYLTNKNKVGVVNNFNPRGALKDVYLVPVREDQKIPAFMEPIDGIGLGEKHPAILLALLVRKSDKKKVKPKPIEKKEKKEEQPEPEYIPAVPALSNELFNTIRESLNNPNLARTLNPPPEPPASSDYNPAPPNIAPPKDSFNGSYHESNYRSDSNFDRHDSRDRDNRDRDRRSYVPGDRDRRDDYQRSSGDYQRTSHWDRRENRRDDYNRQGYRGRRY